MKVGSEVISVDEGGWGRSQIVTQKKGKGNCKKVNRGGIVGPLAGDKKKKKVMSGGMGRSRLKLDLGELLIGTPE